jgi:hypothetical protein
LARIPKSIPAKTAISQSADQTRNVIGIAHAEAPAARSVRSVTGKASTTNTSLHGFDPISCPMPA